MEEPGESRPQDPLDDVFREWDALAGSGRRPGGSLLLALAARGRRVAWGAERRCRAAAFLGVEPGAFGEVLAFVERVLTSTEPLVLCRGTSCTLNGAAELHDRLRSLLRAQDAWPEEVVVYCLDRCESGPSFMCGPDTYCAGLDRMADRRSWRSDTGPIPLDDGGASVRE